MTTFRDADEIHENDPYGDDPDVECTECGGDGVANYHEEDPLWYPDDYITCKNCGGSGLAKDMTVW